MVFSTLDEFIGVDVHCKLKRTYICTNTCIHIYKPALSFTSALHYLMMLISFDRIPKTIYLFLPPSLITTPNPKG